MGFDIYGRRARSRKGEYFRNNVWWWRPLAEYVLRRVKMSAKEREHYWSTNDGVRVSARTSLRIANTLDHLIEEGHTARYQRQYEAHLAALPNDDFMRNYPFSVENVKEFAEFCRDSGGFEIY